jgi:hypothetical protein
MKSSRRETLTGGGVTGPGPHLVSSAVAKGRLPRGVFVLERGVSVVAAVAVPADRLGAGDKSWPSISG